MVATDLSSQAPQPLLKLLDELHVQVGFAGKSKSLLIYTYIIRMLMQTIQKGQVIIQHTRIKQAHAQ